jgi:hypothetical protein
MLAQTLLALGPPPLGNKPPTNPFSYSYSQIMIQKMKGFQIAYLFPQVVKDLTDF